VINLNELSNNSIQIYGSLEDLVIRGFATKVIVSGNQNKVWQYTIKIIGRGRSVKIQSGENEGTLTNVDKLRDRLERLLEREVLL